MHLGLRRFAPIPVLLLVAGCMSWTRGWEPAPPPPAGQVPEIASQIAEVETAVATATDETELRAARTRAADLLARAPGERRLLLAASRAALLQGAAYDERRGAKAASYRRGIQLAERAMATDRELADRVAAGDDLDAAVSALEADDAEAMLLWVTGVSYYFKECLSGLGHIVHFRWMRRAEGVLERLMEVAPDHENGVVPMSLGIYYLALPEAAGGDLERAEELMAEAVEQSSTSLVPRWARAKYLAVKTGDRETFRRDLEWVVAQDAERAASPPAWNVYFQRDARRLLERADELF